MEATPAFWFPSPSPESTREAARLLAGALNGAGAAIALLGPLGAGKTAFVKGLAEGLGLDPLAVGSPTFVIACEYPLPDGRRLGHVDCYRVSGEDELDAAGFLDLLEPGVVLAVEWADRVPGALPADHVCLRLEPALGGDGEARRIEVLAGGAQAARIVGRWHQALADAGIPLPEQAR